MNARYWQRGETLDYTATEAVTNGQVVSLGNRIGVAGNDIAEGATGIMTPRRTKSPPPKRAMSPPDMPPLPQRPATPPCW